MGLDKENSTPKLTPCLKVPLHKDVDGDPCSESFTYSITATMLLCTSGHSRPNIAYSVSQVAGFTLCPKHSHEAEMKMIGRCLLRTRKKGLTINPKRELKMDAHAGVDFAGLCGHED